MSIVKTDDQHQPEVVLTAPDETKPLRVAHVVLSLDVGGLERLVVDLVRQGAQRGQRVAVVCLERPGMLADEARAAGAELFCVEKRPGLRPGIIAHLVRLLGELQLDVVHTHQIAALLYAGAAARRSGIPAVIHTEHGKHYARRRTRWLGRLAARYAQRFCCVSGDIAAAVRAARVAPEAKVMVVPNGIDVERFRGQRPEVGDQGTEKDWDSEIRGQASETAWSRGPGLRPLTSDPCLTIGTIGRLNEIKRQDVLLRAFARLVRRRCHPHPNPLPEGEGIRDLRLLLVGDGPMRGELERLAEELGIRAQTQFAGYQAVPEEYLRRMDIFALTSRSEGMPLSILEAWATGVPVVASRVGGVPELIDDGLTGRLFASGDDAELAHVLEAFCADRQLRDRLSAAGLARVQRDFSLTRMAAEYEAIYRSLLSARRQPAGARE
ncbi:MAG TPA: glycosyltransferase [Pirellulales bacterium]